MEQKGEFEQRPEVKPADQIPFSKPKASPLPWILCILFAVTTVGLGVFLVLGGMKKSEGPKTNCTTVASNDDSGEGTGEIKTTGFAVEGQLYNLYLTNGGDLYISAKTAELKSHDLSVKYDFGEIGSEEAEYTLKASQLGGYEILGSEKQEITFKGYKLNLEDIVYINNDVVNGGHAFNYQNIALIDKSGNLSILSIDPYDGDDEKQVILYKNIEKNVAAIHRVSGGSYSYMVINYRNGGVEIFDFEKHNVRN